MKNSTRILISAVGGVSLLWSLSASAGLLGLSPNSTYNTQQNINTLSADYQVSYQTFKSTIFAQTGSIDDNITDILTEDTKNLQAFSDDEPDLLVDNGPEPRQTIAVPEPGTLGLLGLGIIALIARRVKFQKSA